MDKLLTVDFVFIYVNVVCLQNAPPSPCDLEHEEKTREINFNK